MHGESTKHVRHLPWSATWQWNCSGNPVLLYGAMNYVLHDTLEQLVLSHISYEPDVAGARVKLWSSSQVT